LVLPGPLKIKKAEGRYSRFKITLNITLELKYVKRLNEKSFMLTETTEISKSSTEKSKKDKFANLKEKAWLTIPETAFYISHSKTTVREWIKTGKFQISNAIGSTRDKAKIRRLHIRVSRKSIDDFMSDNLVPMQEVKC
jgi:DNA-binding transcriptional regulator YiaG